MNSQDTFKFEINESPIPLLKCTTNSGKQFYAMVDTGSEITLIDNSLEQDIEKLEEEATDITLCSLNGEQTTKPLVYKLKCSINDTKGIKRDFNVRGITSDLSSISDFMQKTYGWRNRILVVIGSDTLMSRNAHINCEIGQLTI